MLLPVWFRSFDFITLFVVFGPLVETRSDQTGPRSEIRGRGRKTAGPPGRSRWFSSRVDFQGGTLVNGFALRCCVPVLEPSFGTNWSWCSHWQTGLPKVTRRENPSITIMCSSLIRTLTLLSATKFPARVTLPLRTSRLPHEAECFSKQRTSQNHP